MEKILKRKKIIIAVVLCLFLVILAFSVTFIIKIPFTEKYIAIINDGGNEESTMRKYMEKRGWEYDNNQLGGGLMIFNKDEEEIKIFHRDIKTINNNGSSNFDNDQVN